MARTDTLPHFLTDVADAIREKTGSQASIQASSFDTEISNISGGGTDLSEYFNSEIIYNSTGSSTNDARAQLLIRYPDVITIASNVTSLNALFLNTYELKDFPKLVGGDNVTDMTYLYRKDNGITVTRPIDLSGLVTTNATKMEGMFYQIKGATTIDFSNSNFNTEKVTTMESMFAWSEYTTLDLSSFASTALTKTTSMFEGCTSLQFLDLRNFDFTNITTTTRMFGQATNNYKVPANCKIIVADQTQKNWVTTNFSWLTNVKTVAEYEAE